MHLLLVKTRMLLAIYILIFSICMSPDVLAQRYPTDEAADLFNDSLTLFRSQRYNESLQKLEQAVKIVPNYPDAYVQMGIVLYVQDKYKESDIALKKAVDLYENGKPTLVYKYNGAYQDKGDAFVWYGNSLFAQGKYNESSQIYSKAIQAYEDYMRALEQEPEPVSAHTFGGETAYEVQYPDGRTGPMDEQFTEAINVAKKETLSALSEPYYWKGYSLYAMDLPEEAQTYYSKAKAINQTFVPYSSYK
jgi:tetratricopeptide (TPR) repeat protein